MHLDLIEALRCPRGHAEGWLVLVPEVVAARRVERGTIGCPTCGGEWQIRDGELSFDESLELSPRTPCIDHSSGESAQAAAPSPSSAHDAAMRLAALLNLTEASGTVALFGEAAAIADALVAITGVRALAVDAPPGVATRHSRLRVGRDLPLGVGTLRGACIDRAHASWIPATVRAVQQGGRIVAPAVASVPSDVKELARDEREWVGEVVLAASGLVPLRRAGDPLA